MSTFSPAGEVSAGLPDDNSLVIGEGVVLDLQPASFASRLVTGLIDYTVYGLVLVASTVAFAKLIDGLDFAAAMSFVLAAYVAAMVGLPTLVETLTRGRSLGRWVLGARVVRDDGGPIRLRHAVIRALVGVLEVWSMFGAIAIICSLLNARGKRVGDLLAGTYVVRERGYQAPEQPIVMPPGLQTWAAGADLGRLPVDLTMRVRQFLVRANSLAPAARAQVGHDLAAEVRPRVHPGPPASVPAEAFLAAVIAERRNRDLARLQREAAAAARREQVVHRLPHQH